MQSMKSIDVVRDIYEAFGAGDVPKVVGAMKPDIEWRQAEGQPYRMSGEPWTGPDAIVENLFKKLAGEWEGFTVRPEKFHDAGSSVVVEGRYNGNYKATGRDFDAQFCHVWGLDGNKVSSFQQYTDTAQFQHVMGRQAAA
jgi:ketosteroid isomerase-like protein